MRIDKSKLFRRSGFTLVEMLVAAAVSIMLMVILTQAFAAGLDMFRRMRAQGNMQERLRQTSITLRDDLTRPHFETAGAGRNSRLSYRRLDQAYSGGGEETTPADYGFVRLWQGQMLDLAGNPIVEPPFNVTGGNLGASTPLPFALEGTDSDDLMFARATTHLLHMTVRRQGGNYDECFRCPHPNLPVAPGLVFPGDYVFPRDFRESNFFTSSWAEVAYFLVPTGQSTGGGVPLFTMHRRSKLLIPAVPSQAPLNEVAVAAIHPEVSTRQQISPPVGNFYSRSNQVTQPRFRSFMVPAPNIVSPVGPYLGTHAGVMEDTMPNRRFLTGNRYPTLAEDTGSMTFAGDDILLHDVISFEIKAMWDSPQSPIPFILTPLEVQALQPRIAYLVNATVVPNSDYPFDYIPFSVKNQYFANRQGRPPLVPAMPGARVFDTWSDAPGSPYAEVVPPGNPNPGPPPSPPGQPPGPPPFPPGQGPGSPGNSTQEWERTDPVADQNTSCRLPLAIRIKALQIRIRIWDAKTEQTRQITIIQDM